MHTADMSADRASLTREQQSWYLVQDLWWQHELSRGANCAGHQVD